MCNQEMEELSDQEARTEKLKTELSEATAASSPTSVKGVQKRGIESSSACMAEGYIMS